MIIVACWFLRIVNRVHDRTILWTTKVGHPVSQPITRHTTTWAHRE